MNWKRYKSSKASSGSSCTIVVMWGLGLLFLLFKRPEIQTLGKKKKSPDWKKKKDCIVSEFLQNTLQ